MPVCDDHMAQSTAPLRGPSLRRRDDERAAVRAIMQGLIRAVDEGWSLEASQPEGSYRGLWGKTFVRFFARDAKTG